MGFRFRKSVKAGPFRMNFSKSGVGASVGNKYFRYTQKAGGGTRSTVTLPGTGLSYVEDHKSGSSSRRSYSSSGGAGFSGSSKPTNPVIELLLCIFLGWMGAHRFYKREFFMGWLYIFTLGFCGIGWIGDLLILVSSFCSDASFHGKKCIKPIAYVLAFFLLLIPAGCSSEGSDLPTDPTTVTEVSEATRATEHTEATRPSETTQETTAAPETSEPVTESTEPMTEPVPETSEAAIVPPVTKAPTVPKETDPPGIPEETEPPTEAPEAEPPETTEAPTLPPETEPPTEAPAETAAPPENPAETAAPPENPAETAAPPETEAPPVDPEPEPETHSYVLNTHTGKFHLPSCRDVKRIKPENRQDYTGTREALLAQDYSPCGHCHP